MSLAILILAIFGLITSTVFAGMVLWAVPGYLRERRASLRMAAERPGFTPPLSLIKPLHGMEPGLEAWLESFYRQDYPEYEILFAAREASDAGLAVARQVAARHPEIPSKLIVTGGQPDYINAKVASLEWMEREAAHEILVVSDSDVRVSPEYLRAVAMPFADQSVGGMCCLYRGVAAEGGLWARLEAVGMSVEMSAGVLVARRMEGMQFVLGPTMAFRRATVRKMGGFAVAAEYCADDFIYGQKTHRQGERVVLSHHAIDHMVINSAFLDSMKHQVRWMKSTRFSRPKGHFGTSLTFSMPFGLLGLAAGLCLGHLWLALGLLAWAVVTRWAIAFAVGGVVVGDRSWFGLLALYPLRDLMGFGFWAASYCGRRILWRGRVFELLAGGKMQAAKR